MFQIHGPTYRYQGERLATAGIIYIKDHHHDTERGYALQQLLDNSMCPADQHLLVFDHVLRQDEFKSYPHVCLPLLLSAETKEFNQESIDIDWKCRTHAFNFMINKPRPHRLLLMDMIDRLNLTDYLHSLCWNQPYKSIIPTDFSFGDERHLDQGILNGHHRNASTYARLLKRSVFEPTCVSLITEPAWQEHETILTEKTLMAVWAGTIPIWIGGWCCAATMSNFGFDVFDDIVDHSYQDLENAEQRCIRAIDLNLHLLQRPIDMAPLRSRLQHNLDLLRTNVFLRHTHDLLERFPQLDPLVQQFRNGFLVRD